MTQEALVLEILSRNATVTIEGNLLTIADLDGKSTGLPSGRRIADSR